MGKASLAEHMKESRPLTEDEAANAGPFIAISRQFGCHGFSMGLLLLEILNEGAEPDKTWKIYHREILTRLATETNLAAEILDRERRAKPRMLVNFFRSLGKERVPSGIEIRNRISTIIRGLAIEGHAILIGQGSAGATIDLPNGLTVRLEAPEEWRVKQIAFREGISDTQARLMAREQERERQYLRKLYETRFHRKTPFHVVYDCSAFSLAQIAQQIVYALKPKGCIPKR